jgi:hypothetical protein
MTMGLLFAPKNEKAMEPCHVTGLFQTSLLSAVMDTSQEKELNKRS